MSFSFLLHLHLGQPHTSTLRSIEVPGEDTRREKTILDCVVISKEVFRVCHLYHAQEPRTPDALSQTGSCVKLSTTYPRNDFPFATGTAFGKLSRLLFGVK